MTREKQTAPPVTGVPEADWVLRMREYYSRTGSYRPRDLQRLLGNPWDSAEIGSSGHVVLASKAVRSPK